MGSYLNKLLSSGQPPSPLTPRRTRRPTSTGKLVFRPHFVQRGAGLHLLDWAYASDEKWDAFRSDISASREGVAITDTHGVDRFGIDVRWNVEGFGYLFLTADNAGNHYRLPPEGETVELNLNLELARSRVARNERRRSAFESDGWNPAPDVRTFLDLSTELLHDAEKTGNSAEQTGELAQKALYHALWGSETMETAYADFLIERQGRRDDFFSGCDARAFYQMRTPELFMELFEQAFNYATITYVWSHDGVIGDFERTEGEYNFEFRDRIFERMRTKNIAVEGRPIVWFHTWVTPDWIKAKSFDGLKQYVEKHIRTTIGHYGDGMYAWEIVNEFHDWANEVQLPPDQVVELTKFACDVAKDVAPKVHRLINHCCPFAEYVQLGQWSGQEARYPQRTPWEFTRDLADAGVDFTVIGQQMYFPYRDLQDIIVLTERFREFGRPVQLSEVGCPGGPTERSVKLDSVGFPVEDYPWRRPWDERLQADWLESVYKLAYSRTWIEACNWFDFVDPHSYIDNGGLVRSPEGEAKEAYDRLVKLRNEWGSLPDGEN